MKRGNAYAYRIKFGWKMDDRDDKIVCGLEFGTDV
jgi:hypothetical protein